MVSPLLVVSHRDNRWFQRQRRLLENDDEVIDSEPDPKGLLFSTASFQLSCVLPSGTFIFALS